MKMLKSLPVWPLAAPLVGWLLLFGATFNVAGAYQILLVAGLIGSVLAAVYHAEVVAHRIGEPYGTLVLALAVTLIEVALIVSLMLAGGPETTGLARDTVFAAIMIILNGIVGICLLLGAGRHREQSFGLLGVSASLATLAAIAILTLVLPNYTSSAAGPYYNSSQLIFIAVISLVLYGTFVLVQTVRHRDYFLPEEAVGDEEVHAAPPTPTVAWVSAGALLVCLGAVVLLAKSLAPALETAIAAMGAPKTLVGIVIAAIVLLPEGLAAVRAARANRLQTSLNLALGSALASIGLTIPAVVVVSLATGLTITLGLDIKSTVLLLLSLMVATLSLGTGRTTVMQGTVHLVIFAVYLFTTIVP
ncbi:MULTISPECIES: ionic transporter y4hA [unclassified Janthinobacterium]|uniref:Ionic transporter y4hA n=1 Tax=Janthinobacterium lividum TaxID=29581 RepID=A0A1E8PLZ4_9BURK|nr:ionic transporter y4hA [Janthinobacterium sp. CG_23.4]MDH6157563.1 Ca2+:H+ antiporter [Janthinobacterium sp. CG_23.4]OFJ46927.1 ionic transporter y4hA [Janthinobacterium lividum]